MWTGDESEVDSTKCVCNKEISYEDSAGKCYFCNPANGLKPGSGENCVCDAGKGTTEDVKDKCEECPEKTYHRFDATEKSLLGCSACDGVG